MSDVTLADYTGTLIEKSFVNPNAVPVKKQVTRGGKTFMQTFWVVEGEDLPKHIQELKIPPSWEIVYYSKDPNADVQVVGKDSKNRLQYVYSEVHNKKQAEAKFARINALFDEFDSLVKKNKSNTQEEALLLNLIMETGIRPGSERDTKSKVKAYGATTLQAQHITQEGDKVFLNYIGKKGVELKIPVNNPEIAKMLLQRKKAKKPTDPVFDTTYEKLRSYVSSLTNNSFKTKDFRTILGTKTALQEMKKYPQPTTAKEYRSTVMKVAKAVANKLGNTPAVALRAYIDPAIFTPWRIDSHE